MASPRPNTNRKKEPRDVISPKTRDRAKAAKAYIQQKYQKKRQQQDERKEQWELLSQKMNDLNLDMQEQNLIRQQILHRQAQQMRQKRQKVSILDFQPIKIIGKGAFGQVRVVRYRKTREILALKKMNKSEMLQKNQVQHIKTERDLLASATNPWVVGLKFSFQDEYFLYLVMQYLAGGDLMTLLIRRNILPEAQTRFYIAEIILSVESIHKMNYIHRDLKPDNILLDNEGHLKLSDFGLSKNAEIYPDKSKQALSKMDDQSRYRYILDRRAEFRRNRKLAFSTVGTPDYIAPEVFTRQGYSQTVDWWSVGVIMFQMLVGYPPFYADKPPDVCQKIMQWKKHFYIPSEARLSRAAKDLINRLVCEAHDRLGNRGVDQIKAHPFFAGVNWETIRNSRTPFVPEIKSEIDTSNFDDFDENEPFYPVVNQKKKRVRKDLNFVGYTYKRDVENQRTGLVMALEELEAIKQSSERPDVDEEYVLTSDELYSS